MEVRGNSFCKVERNLQSLDTILKSAFCEWFLIFLMLIDAFLSYVMTKFAYLCKLQTPCILCSRLDHLLGKEKNNYRNLLCANHRLEISSLISCYKHNKLVDGKEMCDACLCSFTTNNKYEFDSRTQRLLVGKLRSDSCGNGARGNLLNGDSVPHCIGTRSCSCCSKPWRSRSKAQAFLQLKSSGNGATKPNIPLPPRLNSRRNLKKVRDTTSGSVALHHAGKTGFDLLSRVGYTEVKITSDSESDVLSAQDGDDDSNSIYEKSEHKEDSVLRYLSKLPLKPHCNNRDQVKPSINFFDSRTSPLESHLQVDLQKHHNVKSLASDANFLHGPSEFNWLPANQTANLSALPELISLDDPPTSTALGLPCGKSVEKRQLSYSLSLDSAYSCLPELTALDCTPQLVGISAASEETETYNTGFAYLKRLEDRSTLISTTLGGCPETNGIVYESAMRNSNNVEDDSVRKSSVSDKEQEIFSFDTGQLSEKEYDIVIKDLQPFPVQNVAAERIDLSSNVEGQNHSICNGDSPEGVASQFDIIQVFNKSGSVESDIKSLDGSNASEIEGENVVERLRRQVEYDRNCISSLYKELEEERSASEIAANQAMAMITRLQEEKAAVHMEALQYLRMMEEQAEYDVEALEKANDLINEKEKEIQDLEAELEFYKANYLDDTIVEIDHEKSQGVNEENDTTESNGERRNEYNANQSFRSTIVEVSKEGSNRSLNLDTSSSEFEDRKIYIDLCLKSLEDKINKISTDELLDKVPKSIKIEKLVNTEEKGEDCIDDVRSHRNKEQNGSSNHMDKHTYNGIVTAEKLVDSDNNYHFGHEENFSNLNDHISCANKREVDLIALEHKVSNLTGRLGALQADYDFLEHSLISLQYGEEGLQFIQDIAYQLRELCKLGIRLDRQSGA